MPQIAKNDRLPESIKTHKILVDTCFLMHRNFDLFLNDHTSIFQANRLLIPRRVVQELHKIEKKNDHRLQTAQAALKSIETAVNRGLAELRGEPSDDHAIADNVIGRVVEQYIAQYDILVLTNDRMLRDWVYAKKRSGCFRSKHSLLVVRFGPLKGTPHIWDDVGGLGNSRQATRQVPARSPALTARTAAANTPQQFATPRALEMDLDVPLTATEDVEGTGVVYQPDGRAVHLLHRIGAGGEGTVFETDQGGVLCKVYHRSRLTKGAQRKIELMATRKVSNPAICWPLEVVRDSQGVFRGFVMPRASGEPLGHGLFIPTVWLQRHPNWTRRQSVRLAIRILEEIDYLHRMNVILGDINPMNILVKDERTVFLVDCDSFQVQGFPCPVGSVNFVAPEIQGQDFGGFLRAREHELFAVATLLFMLMMPGKPPYSHQGGADGAANIKKMHFPYPLGEKGSRRVPEGAWRFCWSHLNRALKEAFHASFSERVQGQSRVTVREWIRLFKNYEITLSKNEDVFTGPNPALGYDLSILPHNKRYWQNDVGEVLPYPIPQDGKTDLQRSVRRIAASSAPLSFPGPQANATPKMHTPAATATRPSPIGFGGAWQSQPSTQPTATAAAGASPTAAALHPAGGMWYSHPLIWPVLAPIKAISETAAAGIVGAILGAMGLGLLMMMFGNYEGFGLGALLGACIGTPVGLWLAGRSISKADGGMFMAGGSGVLAGSIGLGLGAGSSTWAVIGAALGLAGGLLVRRLQIGEQKAAEYMRSWCAVEYVRSWL